MDNPEILLKTKRILACVKPTGLISEDGEHNSLPRLLSEMLGASGEKGDVYTVHRLDKAVGGVIVFARDSRTAADLTSQIAGHEFQKCYLAVLDGVPEEREGRLVDLLYHDKAKNKTYAVKRERRGVKEAILEYRVIGVSKNEGKSLVLVKLITGRTHQIRAQFSSRRLPLSGDRRYGSADRECDIALWSASLRFASDSKTQYLTKKPPDSYPWRLFGDTEFYEKILEGGFQ